MAYTFPLALEQFFLGLPITKVDFDLPEALEMSQNGAGEILTADIADRLWRADITLRLGSYYEMEAIKAKLHMLRYAGRSLIVHQLPIIGPQSDPDGSILGQVTPYLSNVSFNNRDIELSGLPIGYKLQSGDGLSFEYGSNPVRYAFHQIVSNWTSADGNAFIEITPFVAPGWAVNTPIKLVRPEFKAVVVPGTFKPGTSGQQVTDGVQFSLIQTFR